MAAKDAYGFGVTPNYQDMLMKYVQENEQDLRRWVDVRPTVERSYDDLVSDLQAGNIKFNPVPRENWKQHLAAETSFDPEGNTAAFYQRKDDTIVFPEDQRGMESLPHEIKHYFASHRPGEYGAPKKINPYIKADVALKGWLPSFHPAGRRPTLPEGPLGIGKWWNEKHATKDAEYSNKRGYHPWLDEDAFDNGHEDARGLLDLTIPKDKPVDWVKTKGGDYPIYEKESKTAQTFRDAFSTARHAGQDIFEWDGRKYTTELASTPPKPKQESRFKPKTSPPPVPIPEPDPNDWEDMGDPFTFFGKKYKKQKRKSGGLFPEKTVRVR